jgi:deazaflavin-dependent oxidoreductase (nitroreductase family)
MGWLTPVAIRVGAVKWLPRLLPQITWIDLRLQSCSRGRVSLLAIAGLPNLMLTVPGRKTGRPRTIPLLCVAQGKNLLIAGSSFGSSTTPAWVHNLRAAETVDVRVGGRQIRMTADELSGDDRAQMWTLLSRIWPNYDEYAKRTDRLIPVFRLRPVP